MDSLSAKTFFNQVHSFSPDAPKKHNIFSLVQLSSLIKIPNQAMARMVGQSHFKGQASRTEKKYDSSIQDFTISEGEDFYICHYEKIEMHGSKKSYWKYSTPYHQWNKIWQIEPKLFLSIGNDHTYSYIPRPTVMNIFDGQGKIRASIHHEKLTDQICLIDKTLFGLLRGGKIQLWDLDGKKLGQLPSQDPGRHPSYLKGSNDYLHHCFGKTVVTFDLKKKASKFYHLFEDNSLNTCLTGIAERKGILTASYRDSLRDEHPLFILNPSLELVQKCTFFHHEYGQKIFIGSDKVYIGTSEGNLYFVNLWSKGNLTAIKFGSHSEPIAFLDGNDFHLMTASISYTNQEEGLYRHSPITIIKLWNLDDRTQINEIIIPKALSSLKYLSGSLYYHYHSTIGKISFQ